MSTNTKTTCIVLSYGGALAGLVRGIIAPKDLEQAIFYFSRIFDAPVGALAEYEGAADARGPQINAYLREKYGAERMVPAYLALHSALRQAIADRPRRLLWRNEKLSTWEALNGLLASLSLQEIKDVDTNSTVILRLLTKEVKGQQLPYHLVGFGL